MFPIKRKFHHLSLNEVVVFSLDPSKLLFFGNGVKSICCILSQATDHGTSPLNSTSTVYVSVIDINDNDPQFYDVNKTLHVQENYIGEVSHKFTIIGSYLFYSLFSRRCPQSLNGSIQNGLGQVESWTSGSI